MNSITDTHIGRRGIVEERELCEALGDRGTNVDGIAEGLLGPKLSLLLYRRGGRTNLRGRQI